MDPKAIPEAYGFTATPHREGARLADYAIAPGATRAIAYEASVALVSMHADGRCKIELRPNPANPSLAHLAAGDIAESALCAQSGLSHPAQPVRDALLHHLRPERAEAMLDWIGQMMVNSPTPPFAQRVQRGRDCATGRA